MFERLVREQAGMTMGLAVIMIALIGVMGAGLLVFVQSDLATVVEVNRGQKAHEISDVGIQAARRQLLVNSFPDQYNDPATFAPSPDPANSAWAFNNGSATCGILPVGPGKCIDTSEGQVRVTIRYLPPTTSATGTGSRNDPDYAPVNSPTAEADYDDDRDYFRVESDGVFNGARRKIQTIMITEDIGVPQAYFTPNDIKLAGTTEVKGVSMFSLGDVALSGKPKITGSDQAYKNWYRPPYNTASRSTINAGIGAVGDIDSEVSGRDYDGKDGPNPRFVQDPSKPQNSTTQMTFPFDYKTQAGTQDQIRMDFFREEAKANGIYQTSSGGAVEVGTDFAWPANSTDQTVVFVEFTSAGGTNRVDWSVGSKLDPPVKGTLVIKGGNFKMTQHKACLDGVVIVRGGIYEEGTSTDGGGNTCLNGFVNASGDIEIKGNVTPAATSDVINRPGFHSVKIWSWRECYNTACN